MPENYNFEWVGSYAVRLLCLTNWFSLIFLIESRMHFYSILAHQHHSASFWLMSELSASLACLRIFNPPCFYGFADEVIFITPAFSSLSFTRLVSTSLSVIPHMLISYISSHCHLPICCFDPCFIFRYCKVAPSQYNHQSLSPGLLLFFPAFTLSC